LDDVMFRCSESQVKCHKETPCIATLNKQKCVLSKLKDKKVKQSLSKS
jgi:hypothetical protein